MMGAVAQAQTASGTSTSVFGGKLVVLALAMWAGLYARSALGPLQETMRAALGLTDGQIALLLGPSAGIAVLAGSVPLGLLVDRYSRVRLLLIFMVLSLAGSIVTATSTYLPVLFGARSIVALAQAACSIATFSLIADLYTDAQRGRATMVVLGSADLAAPTAFALGGTLLGMGIGGAGVDDWRSTLLWMTGPPLALVVLLLVGLSEPRRTGVVVKNPPMKQSFLELWSYRRKIIPLLGARCMVGVADGAALTWAASLFARKFDLGPDRVGTLMAGVLLVTGLLGPIAGGFVADFCQRNGGPRRTMSMMCVLALLSLPACLFAVAPGVTLTVILLVVFVTLGLSANTAASVLSTIIVPNELRGTFFAISMVTGALFATVTAPLMVSSLSAVMGGPTALGGALTLVCMAASALGAAACAFGSRSLRPVTK